MHQPASQLRRDLARPADKPDLAQMLQRHRGRIHKVIVRALGENLKLINNLIGPSAIRGEDNPIRKRGLNRINPRHLVRVAGINEATPQSD